MSMFSISHRWRPGATRRATVTVVTAAMTVTALLVVSTLVAARAEAAETPWLTVSADRYASFAVPADYVQSNIGAVSQLVVEGNFGPSSAWTELGLTRRGTAWTAVLGPLEPGSYQYQLTGDDTKAFKDPTNPAGVRSHPTWSTFFVPGDSARLLADVPSGQGGTVGTLTYETGTASQRSALVWTPPRYDAH